MALVISVISKVNTISRWRIHRTASKRNGFEALVDQSAVPLRWRGKWLPLSGRVTAQRVGVSCWRRRFAGRPEQVSAARRFTQLLLADSAVAVDAAWAIGELATNAIRYSRTGEPGGTFTVEVWRWRGFTQIQVTDAGGDGMPALPVEDPATQISKGGWPPEGQMGLCGIGALAHRFGTYQHTDGSRVVWARFESAPPEVVGSAR